MQHQLSTALFFGRVACKFIVASVPLDKRGSKMSNKLQLGYFIFIVVGSFALSSIAVAQTEKRPYPVVPTVPSAIVPELAEPRTPAPEPARPNVDPRKSEVKPSLPPAPAEKMGEPIRKID